MSMRKMLYEVLETKDSNSIKKFLSDFGHVDFDFKGVIQNLALKGDSKTIDIVLALKPECRRYLTEALTYAVKEKNLETVKFLNKKGAILSIKGKESINYAILNSDVNMLDFLLSQGIVMSDFREQYIKLCCENSNLNMLKYLMNKFDGIHFAMDENVKILTGRNEFDMLKFILDFHKDMVKDLKESLLLACVGGDCDTIDLLIEYGANPHGNLGKPLFRVVEGGNLEAVKRLIEHYGLDEKGNIIALLNVANRNSSFDISEYFVERQDEKILNDFIKFHNERGSSIETTLMIQIEKRLLDLSLGMKLNKKSLKV